MARPYSADADRFNFKAETWFLQLMKETAARVGLTPSIFVRQAIVEKMKSVGAKLPAGSETGIRMPDPVRPVGRPKPAPKKSARKPRR